MVTSLIAMYCKPSGYKGPHRCPSLACQGIAHVQDGPFVMLPQQPDTPHPTATGSSGCFHAENETAPGAPSGGVNLTIESHIKPAQACSKDASSQQLCSPARVLMSSPHEAREHGPVGNHPDAGSPFVRHVSSPSSSPSTFSSASVALATVPLQEDAQNVYACQATAARSCSPSAVASNACGTATTRAPKFLSALLQGLSSSRRNSHDDRRNCSGTAQSSIPVSTAAVTDNTQAVTALSSTDMPCTAPAAAATTPASSSTGGKEGPIPASASFAISFGNSTNSQGRAEQQQHAGHRDGVCDPCTIADATSMLLHRASPFAVQEHCTDHLLPAALLLSSGNSFTSTVPSHASSHRSELIDSCNSAKPVHTQLNDHCLSTAKEHDHQSSPHWNSSPRHFDDQPAFASGSGLGASHGAVLELPHFMPQVPTFKPAYTPLRFAGTQQSGNNLGSHSNLANMDVAQAQENKHMQQESKAFDGQLQPDMLNALLAYMDEHSMNARTAANHIRNTPATLDSNNGIGALSSGSNGMTINNLGAAAGVTGFDGLAGMGTAGSPYGTPASRMSSLSSPHSLAAQTSNAQNTTNLLLSTLLGATANQLNGSSPTPTEGNSWEDVTPAVRDKVLGMIQRRDPYIRLQHFDGGVRHWIVQITTLFGEAAALSGLSAIEGATNLAGVRNMRAFITTRLIDYFEQHVFQQDPQGYAAKRLLPDQFYLLAHLVAGDHGLQWSHFDPKVLDTIRDIGNVEYIRSRLQRLTARELSAVQNVPAYIYTLLSKRGKTAKQAAASKGATEAALAALADSALVLPGTPSVMGSPYVHGINGSYQPSPLQHSSRSFLQQDHTASPGVHRSWSSPLSSTSTPYTSPSHVPIQGGSNGLTSNLSHLLGQENGFGGGRPVTKNELLQQVSDLIHMHALQQQMQAAAAQQGMAWPGMPSPQAPPRLGLHQYQHSGINQNGLYNFLNPAAAFDLGMGTSNASAGYAASNHQGPSLLARNVTP